MYLWCTLVPAGPAVSQCYATCRGAVEKHETSSDKEPSTLAPLMTSVFMFTKQILNKVLVPSM